MKNLQPFEFRNQHRAHNLNELITLSQQWTEDAIYHLNNAHFESWLAYIGRADVAAIAKVARELANDDKTKLESFLKNTTALLQLNTTSVSQPNNPVPSHQVVQGKQPKGQKQNDKPTPLKENILDSEIIEMVEGSLELVSLAMLCLSLVFLGLYVGNCVNDLLGAAHQSSLNRIPVILITIFLLFQVIKLGAKVSLSKSFPRLFFGLFSVIGLLIGLSWGDIWGDNGVVILFGYYLDLGSYILGASFGCIIGGFIGFLIDLARK